MTAIGGNTFFVLSMALTALVFLSGEALAHPGRTDSSGGHTCRTNCPSWGYSYGEYHYHGGYSAPTYTAPKTNPLDEPTWDSVSFNLYTNANIRVYSYQGMTITRNSSSDGPTLRDWQALAKAITANGPISNHEVPLIVAREFKSIFGREITPEESTYWKARARSDKTTVSALRGAMQFWFNNGYSPLPQSNIRDKTGKFLQRRLRLSDGYIELGGK